MRSTTRHSAQSNARRLRLICLIALLALAGYSLLPGLRHVLAEGLRPSPPSDISPVVRTMNGDPTFGTNGRVVVSFDASSEANDVAVQTDGKIVVVGGYLNSAQSAGGIAIARLNDNGTLDQTFGTGGKVTTPPPGPVGVEFAKAVIIQPDNKILVAGHGRGNTSQAGVLYRFNSDGSPDTGFGIGGRVFTEIPTQGMNLGAGFNDVALSQDGGIVAVGESRSQVTQPDSNIVVVRYLSNGALNMSFGGLNGAAPGTVVVNVGGFDTGNALAEIRPGDNHILLAGSVSNLGSNPGEFTDGIVQVNLNLADGQANTNFGGGDGIETVLFGPGSDAEANAIAWLPGTTSASSNPGSSAEPNGRAPEANSDHSMVVGSLGLRYFGTFHQPNGSLDSNRAVNGVFFSSLAEEGTGLVLVPRGSPGRALIAGTSTPNLANPSNKDFNLSGYSVLNPYGIDFNYKYDFNNGSFDAARAIAVQGNGNVVLAGVTESEGAQQIGVIRVGPPLPPVFFGSRVDNIIRRKDPVTGAVENFDTLPPSSAGRPVTIRQLAAEQTEDLTPGRLAVTVTDGSDNYLYVKQPGEPSTEIAIVNDPLGLTISGGDLYYSECFAAMCTGGRKLRFRPGITGAARTIPTGDPQPEAVAVSERGDIVFSDGLSGGSLFAMRRLGTNDDGTPMLDNPQNAFNFTGTDRPVSIAFYGGILLVALNNGTVQLLLDDPNSINLDYTVANSASGFGNIGQIAVTETGEILVTSIGDSGSPGAIHRLNQDLQPIGPPLTGTDIQNPTGIAATQTVPPSADLLVSYRVSGISNPFINYEATVQNTGQATAESVVFTITVPPNASSSNLDAAPGFTCTSTPDSEGKLTCTNQSVQSGAAGLDFILSVVANGNGIFPSTATVGTTSRDGDASNNTATAAAAIGVEPTLSVNDVRVNEGNSGATIAEVTVTLSAATAERPRFNIGTADGTATAPIDYIAVPNIQVRLNPLETRRTFQFLVNGDTFIEPDENFFVNISDPNGATIPDGEGTVLILDDDTPPPTISISDVRVVEGTGPDATTFAVFTVSLSGPSNQPVRIEYATAAGTATSPEDYAGGTGSRTIPAGQTSFEISILVNADALDEPDETFFINLTSAPGFTIADGQGTGTIVDDDEPPPPPPLRTFVLPHVLEQSGTITNTTFTFDTQVLAVYMGGANLPPEQGATVDLYLFDHSTGTTMRGVTGEVCNPCSFQLSQTNRKETITIDDLIVQRGGGFDATVKLGYAVIVVGGADPDNVSLQGVVVNSHSQPAFELSVFGFAPVELQAANGPQSSQLSESALGGQTSLASRIDGRVRHPDGQPLTGVNVALLSLAQAGAQTRTVTTDAGGNYSFTSLPDGDDHLVLPLNRAFIFNPNARRFDNLTGNQTSDFTSIPSVGGRVNLQSGTGIDNGTMMLLKDGIPHRIAPTDEQGDYFFRELSPGGNYTVIPSKVNFNFTPSTRQITNLQVGLTEADFMATQIAAPSVVQFGATSYDVGEGDGFLTVAINRTGDTSGAAIVEYATLDGSGSQRTDYTKALGTVSFGPGETSKTINVLLTDDAYVEGAAPETIHLVLSNPAGGVVVGTPGTAILNIAENDTAPSPNPVDLPGQFVENHYHDFLNRPADPAGKAFWMGQITECDQRPEAERQACREVRRINVSAAFFLSIEFQQTGYLVYRAHQAAFDTGPALGFRDFLRDTQEIGRDVVVGQAGWDQKLEANKQAFFAEFVTRSQFLVSYPVTMTAAQYVDALNANTGGSLTQGERDALVSGLTGGTQTRATVMRAVAEDADFRAREFNRAFVFMQYLGYLRRRPNDPPDMNFDGYNFWLAKLNQFNGKFIEAEMVKAFILSGEYRGRFGP